MYDNLHDEAILEGNVRLKETWKYVLISLLERLRDNNADNAANYCSVDLTSLKKILYSKL